MTENVTARGTGRRINPVLADLAGIAVGFILLSILVSLQGDRTISIDKGSLLLVIDAVPLAIFVIMITIHMFFSVRRRLAGVTFYVIASGGYAYIVYVLAVNMR